MQVLILTALISFVLTAPIVDSVDSKSHGFLAGNTIRGSIHAPQNTCNNGVKVIGGENTSFDNSCTNTSVESDTDDHSNSGNGSGGSGGSDDSDGSDDS